MQKSYDAIKEAGGELVAISPQIVDKNGEVKKKLRLDYPVLSDLGNAYAKELCLAFALPDDLRGIYAGFGINLEALHGDNLWELPLPARIVVDKAGTIRSIEAHPDYTIRPEPTATLEVLKGL